MEDKNLEIEHRYLLTRLPKESLTHCDSKHIRQGYFKTSIVDIRLQSDQDKGLFQLTIEECLGRSISVNLTNKLANKLKPLFAPMKTKTWSTLNLSLNPADRIRHTEWNGEDSYEITIKGKSGCDVRVRIEVDVPLDNDPEFIDYVFAMVEENVVEKIRYLIPIENNLVWELDIFKDKLQGLVIAEIEVPSVEINPEPLSIWSWNSLINQSWSSNKGLAFLEESYSELNAKDSDKFPVCHWV